MQVEMSYRETHFSAREVREEGIKLKLLQKARKAKSL